ncbi:MAG TPA: alpha/beta hydrolase [Chitinophagaceae bacterium]
MTVEKTLNYKDKKIFYQITGEGPSVVLLHGVPADGSLWQNLTSSTPRFQFIVPDLPGSGQSEMIGDMSIVGMAEAIKAILDKEKASVVSMIGHSMGGYISLAFAKKYSAYLDGLGLFHSTAYADTEERKETREKAIEFITQNGAYEFLKTSIPNLFSPAHKEKNAGKINEMIRKAASFSSPALIAYYKAMMQRPDRSQILKDSEIPVLFIAGRYDTAIPLNSLLEQCHLPAQSYFHILHESGHMGMIEEIEKSNSIVRNYLINQVRTSS